MSEFWLPTIVVVIAMGYATGHLMRYLEKRANQKRQKAESVQLMKTLIEFAYSPGGNDIAQANKQKLRQVFKEELMKEAEERERSQ